MIKKFFTKYRELISYIFFGVLTTVVSLVSFKIFDVVFGEKLYLLTNVLSWIAAVIFAYVTNKLWVFESKSRDIKIIAKELVGFFGARLFSLGVEEAGLWLLIDLLGMSEISLDIMNFSVNGNMLSKLIMQLVVVILNYIFSKLIVFKRKNTDETDNNMQ